MSIYSPSNYAELRSMLRIAINENNPSAVRYPRSSEGEFTDDTSALGERGSVIGVGSAFGPDGEAVKAYTKTISNLVEPDFPNRFPSSAQAQTQKPFDPDARIANMLRLKALTEEFGTVIARNLKRALPVGQRRSWEYLNIHRDYIFMVTDIVLAGVSESLEVLDKRIDDVRNWALLHEPELHRIMDPRTLCNNLNWIYRENVKASMHE